MVSLLLLASLTTPQPGAQPAVDSLPAAETAAPAVIQGQVVSDQSGMAIPYVLVEVGAGTDYRAVLSDRNGRYTLRGVPAGSRTIRARSLDHSPLEVTVDVPPGERISLDLSLPLRPVNLPTIRVVSRQYGGLWIDDLEEDGGETSRPPTSTELRALEATPGVAELGLAQAARDVTDGDPSDPASALFVRGGGSDLKFVLLDGAPVFAPFHLGGLVEPVPPGVVRSSKLYMGGAPARFDGGLSYILSINTRPGQTGTPQLEASADMVSGRTRVEGSLPGGSYLVSGRGVHGVGAEEVRQEPLALGYADGLARLDFGLGNRDSLSFTGFFNRETVHLDDGNPFRSPAFWGNASGSVRYRGQVGAHAAKITLGGGEFMASLPIGDEPTEVADGRSRRFRLAADLTRSTGDFRYSYGAVYNRSILDFRARGSTDPTSLVIDRHGVGDALAAYGEVAWQPAPELELRGGLRESLFLTAGEDRVSPRLTVAWRPEPTVELSLAGGRYHQYVRAAAPLFAASPEDLARALGDSPGDGSSDGDASLAVAGATHYVLSATGQPADEVKFGLETYLKTFGDPPGGVDLRTTGLDAWVDWSHDVWAAWAGLMLDWTWASRAESRKRKAEFRTISQQIVNGGLRAPLPHEFRLIMEATSSTGLPFTPFPTNVENSASGGVSEVAAGGQTAFAAARAPLVPRASAPTYIRIDAKLYRTWSASFLSTDVEITPYVKLLNALDRRDALFYRYVQEDEELLRRRSLGVVPLLPVLGMEWNL